MKLSVIIPCYKFKSYITQCIDSIVSQNVNFQMEILVRDDGSNDGTIELILEKYKDKNITLLNSDNNLGAVNNLIKLISNCKGEYIAYLDGDDLLIDNDYYQRAVDFLDKNSEFSMFCGGYKYIENDKIYPEPYWLVGGKHIVEQTDLLVENYISFARVFRKFDIKKESFYKILYPDWLFNFECLKYGKSFCDTKNCVGLYRIHDGGMFSKKEISEKMNNKEKMKLELKKRFFLPDKKIISIVDCFISNNNVKNKLINCLNWLSEDDHEILLVSNTSVDKDIQDKVNYFIYDKRNQLFEKEYSNIPILDIFKNLNQHVEVHDVNYSLQKHGLSVLINLFNVLKFAKQQGYTHFQRFEVDDLFGINSREYIKNVPYECNLQNKKGLFYFNKNNFPPDISFHYFYCEIDYFLNKIKNINVEQDYIDYLKDFYGNVDFKIVESFIYDNLVKDTNDEIVKKMGSQMNNDFPDTIWNSESSISNFESKYKGCTTKLYKNKVYDSEKGEFYFNNQYTLLSYSFIDDTIERRIVVFYKNGNSVEYYHKTFCKGYWQFDNIASDVDSILVYQNDNILYKETVDNVLSYVIYR